MFCWSYRQLAKSLWLSLYCIRCKCPIIALLYRYAIAIVARAIVGEMTTWRHIDIDQDDGDHGVMPMTMEIMTMLWRWRSKAQDDDVGHIIITCNQYKWYDMAIIILFLWSPSSKHHRDHHRHRCDTLISIVASLSSRQRLLVLVWLTRLATK